LGKKSRARRQQKGGSSGISRRPPEGFAPLSISSTVERWALFVLLAVGLLLRAFYLIEYRSRSIFYGSLMLDAQVYDQWARRIADGLWAGGPVFYHAPFYPYLLALFYRFLGYHYAPIYLLQLLLGPVVLFLVYSLGRRCASPGAGLAAGYLLLLYPALPFFETKLMATTLAVTLSLLALLLLVQAWEETGLGRWLGAGAAIGVAALAHPASLILAPVFAVARLAATRRLRDAAALACGAMLAVAPATLHNLAAGGGFVLISSQGGITFLQGNSPASRGLYRPVPGFSGSPLTQEEEEKALAEKAVGHPLQAAGVSGYWFRKGLDGIREQPGRYLELLELKFIRLVSSHEYSTEYSLDLERKQIVTLRLFGVPFGLLVSGAAAAIFLGRQYLPRLVPVYLYLLATLAPPMIFYVSSRYRIAAVPALAILAGVTVERLAARFRAGALGDALPATAGILLAGAATLVPYQRDHLFQEANVHYNVGNLYYDQGDYPRAIREYEQALEVNDFEYYRINLGNALVRTGRLEEAIDQYRRVASRNPRFAKAHIQWAKALVQQGHTEEAREQYGKALALGVRNSDLEAKLGGAASATSPQEEIDAIRRAITTDPTNASLHNNLGIALQKVGRTEEAEEEYRKASSLDSRYEKSHFNLGLLLENRGLLDEALAEYEAAAGLSPGYVRAHLKAASILLNRGAGSRAREHFLAVLKVEPENAEARDGLQRARGRP